MTSPSPPLAMLAWFHPGSNAGPLHTQETDQNCLSLMSPEEAQYLTGTCLDCGGKRTESPLWHWEIQSHSVAGHRLRTQEWKGERRRTTELG